MLLKYKENNKKICNTFDLNFKNIPLYTVAHKDGIISLILTIRDKSLSFHN